MYPLNMQLPAPAVGFALAIDGFEHADLTKAGYVPALIPVEDSARENMLVEATEKGLRVDRRWSDARLAEELAAMNAPAA